MAKKKRNESDQSGSDAENRIDFESAIAEVETVVQQLESGELGLSESLVQYERGIQKIKLCHQVLEQAENRIAVLTRVEEDGTASVEPVDLGERSGKTALGGGEEPRKRASAKKVRPPISDVDDTGGLF